MFPGHLVGLKISNATRELSGFCALPFQLHEINFSFSEQIKELVNLGRSFV